VTDNEGIALDIGRFPRSQACKRQTSLRVS
jgi:hypothetical protein